ncbi:hypothetical protein ABPG75_010691 [Micractinium tetrahymenae]
MPKTADAKANGPADQQLAADVKAFAAQLGLSGGGDSMFDDFAPEKARQKIGQQQKGGRKQEDGKASGSGGGGGRQQGDRQQQAGRKGDRRDSQQQKGVRQQGQKPWQLQKEDGQKPWQQKEDGQKPWQQKPQQHRRWGGGGDDGEPVPAPKISNAKSILPRDEPAIWHEAAGTLPALPAPKAEAAPEVVQQRRAQAERLLLVEEQAFEQNMGRRSSADVKWLQQVRRSGTTADKVAAMSVLVQDAAVANLHSLDGLLAMCSKRGGARAVVGSAMDALKELFISVLLPDRKLRFFEQQPLDKLEAGRDGERRLLYWLLEDGLKKRYASFIESLEACSRDNLEFVKDRAVKTMYELLSGKPEGEAKLLAALVNKLGDPDRKLASKVGYLLTRLLADHPGMNVPVVREIERFMFRPGLQDRARYYAVVYLNQMVLSHKQAAQAAPGGSLAKRLIDLYFTLFQMILDGKIGTAAQLSKAQQDKAAAEAARKKKGEAAKARADEAARQKAAEAAAAAKDQSGEMDGRMLSALITGVRRAFPYVPPDEVEPLIEAHADALFRLVHARSFGVATQALLLLFQLMSSRSTVSDRFYRALYSVLGSPELFRSTKAPLFLSLLFKALKADVSSRRAAAFAKRMLQLAQEAPPHFACGCLVLASELLKARPALWGAVLQPEESDADALERFQDAPDGEDGGARQQQAQQQRQQQRARQAVAGSDDEAASGSEGEDDEESEDELADLAGSDSEGSDLERDEGADLMPGLQQQRRQQQQQRQQTQQQQQAAAAAAKAGERWPSCKDAYDMHKREPQFCNADRSCLWELTSLAYHAHPSVAAMARTLLAGQNVVYSGDPLRDLTLGAFLEKFVQKKAKASAKGDSAMQPLAAQQATATAAAPQQWAALAGAHAEALAALAEKDVRPDDMFFHKFYSLQAVQDKAKKKKKKKGEEDDELLSDAESEDSDAADDFLAGEEEGGDDGIGADPDRAGMDYDYAGLAAAMDSDDDSTGAASASDEEEGEEEEGEEEEDEEEGLEELEGATFSDMSDDEEEGSGGLGEEEGEEEEEGLFGGSGSEGEELSGGSGSEGEELSGGSGSDSSDGEFEAALAAEEDLSDEEEDSSEEDDAAADAEVAELIKRHKIKPLPAGGKESKEVEALNPFELAEATSSEGEEDEEAEAGDRQRRGAAASGPRRRRGRDDDGGGASSSEEEEEEGARHTGKHGRKQQQQQQQQKRRKKSDDLMSVFASADDYAAMIDEDLATGQGPDNGEESPRGGRGGRGGGKRHRGGGSGRGGGHGAKQARRR